jgi:hypothetical protein
MVLNLNRGHLSLPTLVTPGAHGGTNLRTRRKLELLTMIAERAWVQLPIDTPDLRRIFGIGQH